MMPANVRVDDPNVDDIIVHAVGEPSDRWFKSDGSSHSGPASIAGCTPAVTVMGANITSRTPTYETYDHPYVKLDVVRVVWRTTSRCFAYGPS
jgi:hypothetical protein